MIELQSNSSLISLLDKITIELSRTVAIFIFSFGFMGNILNILVLLQKSLRSNSCAWLFMAASIANLISMLSGLTTEIMSGWMVDPATHITWMCKIRAFFVFTTRTIAPWFIVLATIDRWLLSSTDANRRRKSKLKNAQRWSAVIVILSIALYAQLFYCYEANQNDTPLKCYGKTSSCRYVTDLSFALITILIPVVLMVLFGLLTIANVHKSQNRIQLSAPMNNNSISRRPPASNSSNTDRKVKQRTDRNLLRMLLIQVLLLTIFTLPLSIQKFYASFSRWNKSPIELSIDVFAYNLSVLIYFVSNGMPFYIYTLFGGTLFRKALYNFLIFLKRKMICQHI